MKTDMGSPGSFAAEAPQMIVRIQEDSKELKKRRPGGTTDIDPQAKNLDLQKAYPIVNKPAIRKMFQKIGMSEKFLSTMMDLHETTIYCVKSRECESKEMKPERSL